MAAIIVCRTDREDKFGARPGQTVAEALRDAGVWSDLPCGGMGTCGGCRIEVRGDVEPPTSHEIEALAAEALNVGWRLACQTKIIGDVRVYPPEIFVASTANEKNSNVPSPAGQLGLAVDLGSTTLVGRLISLEDGRTLAEMSMTNPQVSMGSDLITRIQASLEPGGQAKLRSLALQGINRLLSNLTDRVHLPASRIRSMAVAGNSVMEHIFLGFSVEGLSRFPFEPEILTSVERTASELGIEIDSAAPVYVLPLIGGFVGGDAASGVLATSMASTKDIRLLADLGTNGEIVLAAHGELRATSTAAGPAFEGGEIAWGMRAEIGAIIDLNISDRWRLTVIGGHKPRGIAGSGLVRIVEELLDHGLLGPDGRVKRLEELSEEQNQILNGRIRQGRSGVELVLDPDREIVLTQRDIRQLQLAKGAIHSAIGSLLEEAGIQTVGIDRIYLAGAFGSALDPRSLVRIGLLPKVPIERIEPVGNASLDGAAKVLMDENKRREVEALARSVRHIPLETRPEYQEAFLKALSFPANQS